jgi:hypothetical protein
MENVNTIKLIADFFMLSVSWAMILFSPIASSELTGHGLIKLLSNVAIGALVVSIVISVGSGFNLWLALKGVALVGLILNTSLHQDIKSPFMWALWSLLSVLFPVILLFQYPHGLNQSFFILSASLLLGVITYSMILGHWYLVVPKLSEAPLKKAALITWAILLPKIVWSAIALWQNKAFFEEQTMLGSGYAFNWTLLLMRIAFGYIVISGMSFFNWKLLKLRSIQSSTGVLYAMTFFVFIGELVSTYLFYNYGLFI